MSQLFSKKFKSSYIFNKEEVLEDIKQKIPSPWVWYTLGVCMEEVDDPKYDLLIMRNKDVHEKITINRPWSISEREKTSVYSVILGVYIVETLSWNSIFDTTHEFVTAAVQVNSSYFLLDNIIGAIDNNLGGITNVS